ncbi:hypothetical protein VKT23_019112 [Stygiomarasmius scandens]|uniref:F-box domain-containing protein n=1 Tax=Marasmiellus scandens TaxID=2682957 RepID=A0ABR1IRU2_9AGAR
MCLLPRDVLVRLIDLHANNLAALKNLLLGLGPDFRKYIQGHLLCRIHIINSDQVEEICMAFRTRPYLAQNLQRISIRWWKDFGKPSSCLNLVELLTLLPQNNAAPRVLCLSNFRRQSHIGAGLLNVDDEEELENVITMAVYRAFRTLIFEDCIFSRVAWRDCLSATRMKDMDCVSLIRCNLSGLAREDLQTLVEGGRSKLGELYIESCPAYLVGVLGNDYVAGIIVRKLHVLDPSPDCNAGECLSFLLPLVRNDLVELTCESQRMVNQGNDSVGLMFNAFHDNAKFRRLQILSLTSTRRDLSSKYSLTLRIAGGVWTISYYDRHAFHVFVSSEVVGWHRMINRIQAAARHVTERSGIQFLELLHDMFDGKELDAGLIV